MGLRWIKVCAFNAGARGDMCKCVSRHICHNIDMCIQTCVYRHIGMCIQIYAHIDICIWTCVYGHVYTDIY